MKKKRENNEKKRNKTDKKTNTNNCFFLFFLIEVWIWFCFYFEFVLFFYFILFFYRFIEIACKPCHNRRVSWCVLTRDCLCFSDMTQWPQCWGTEGFLGPTKYSDASPLNEFLKLEITWCHASAGRTCEVRTMQPPLDRIGTHWSSCHNIPRLGTLFHTICTLRIVVAVSWFVPTLLSSHYQTYSSGGNVGTFFGGWLNSPFAEHNMIIKHDTIQFTNSCVLVKHDMITKIHIPIQLVICLARSLAGADTFGRTCLGFSLPLSH